MSDPVQFGVFTESRAGQFRESAAHARNGSIQKQQWGLGTDIYANPETFVGFNRDVTMEVSVPTGERTNPHPPYSGFSKIIWTGFPGYLNDLSYGQFQDYMFPYSNVGGHGVVFRITTKRTYLPGIWYLFCDQDVTHNAKGISRGLESYVARLISFDRTQEIIVSPPTMSAGYTSPLPPGFISVGSPPITNPWESFYLKDATVNTKLLFGRSTNFYAQLTVYTSSAIGYGRFGFKGGRLSAAP